ncbi:MAG: hypothetical protein GY906_35650 [bacterium]|nr:hypothetical protein [bacterium]
MTATTTTKPTMTDLMGAWTEALTKLRDAERADTLEDLATLERYLNERGWNWYDLFSCAYTDQGSRGLRLRSSALSRDRVERQDDGRSLNTDYELWNVGAALFGHLKWHRSGGALDGLMIAEFRTPREIREGLEWASVILQTVLHGHSPASNAWNRALGR